MGFRNLITAACFVCVLATPISAWAGEPGRLADGLDAMYEVERELPVEADPAPALKDAFARHFGQVPVAALSRLSDADLKAYLAAANRLTFYTYDPADLALAEAAFSNLEARNLEVSFDVETMFKNFVAYRMFERARALAARYPDIEFEPLPRFTGLDGAFDGPTVLALDDAGVVSRVAAGVPAHGPYVVVAAHPLCHFSANAVRAIEQDADVSPLFAGRTLWLMPQDGHMNIDVVRDWNREFPGYAMRWAYRTADWPMIKRWSTPNFYFYRDGTLVDTVVGWPQEGNRDALLAAFARIGVVPGGAAQRSR
jgi:hypothetical protein